ncbi:fimbrial protein [Acinetobacter rudis]|uniref:Fimbrial-type adhesion domain-containing protein n=1 Tax=Acinetobacter rudis CIP 110305 TaxID=421052 RepID=S3N187_9GAMM|nr:fimbrial protein [Acinetobacter rudis]EPF73885.1 hypothetical protein F945_01764 [Acinetobacter rudis CIP 110305]
MNLKHIFLIPSLLLCGVTQQAFANGCTPNAPSTRHTLMKAYAGTIKVSGNVEKYQKIAEFNFQHNATGVPYVAECSDDATIYAYAGQGSPTERGASSIGDIDGQPAFVLPNSYAGGENHYAYVLIDNLTGRPYGDRGNPSELRVNEGDNQDSKMRPRQATVIIYANIDNPTKAVQLGNVTLGGLLPGPPGNPFGSGVTYMFDSGNIAAAEASCEIENANNLTIDLPRAPLSALNRIGTTSSRTKGELKIQCTGDMRAHLSLNLSNNQVQTDDDGDESVIKNSQEGREFAKGIGFVSSTEDGKRLINRKSVFLKNLDKGETKVPIYAEYYRYGDEVSAGKVEASANFIMEFK